MNDLHIPKTELERLRKDFPAGCRVQLTNMDDAQAPAVGTHGTVLSVDDIGTIHVKWDTGSSLGVVYGEDSCVRIGGEPKNA